MEIKSIQVTSEIILDMTFVEGGEYNMGADYQQSALPIHKVKVESFYIAKYQVSQEFWEAIMGSNPSNFKGANRPVEMVSWEDVQQFLVALNQKTDESFRLPSESEWEYMACGGRYSQAYVYAGSDKLSQVGWYLDNSNNETHEVGLLLPNELGLYDMSGNVWEWCADDWHEDYKDAPADGSVWVETPYRGAERVLRGGSCLYGAELCRPAVRSGDAPDVRGREIGFRLAMSLQSAG